MSLYNLFFLTRANTLCKSLLRYAKFICCVAEMSKGAKEAGVNKQLRFQKIV